MRITQYSLLAAILLALAVPAGAAEQHDCAALVAVLQSDAPKADKAITCKRLAVFGSADAVPALAPLLEDAELASWARIALEVIPGPAADKALRDTIQKVDGRLLSGVVNSIGVRRDAAAVADLAQLLKHSNADVAEAAAAALGHVGGAEATKTLQAALATAPDGVRSAVAEGCILCAEQLMKDGENDTAAQVYAQVRKANLPKQRIAEATRGEILARQMDGVPLLLTQLQSEDRRLYQMALMTARELAGDGVTEALVAGLAKVPADRQDLMILALADRGDPAVLPAMLSAAEKGPLSVRAAAIAVVGQLGDASCLPVLLKAASASDAKAAQAARAALETLPGDDVDRAIAARLDDAIGSDREILIQLVGQRRIPAVAPLLKAAGDSKASVRSAALTALGETVELDNVAILIERVVAPQHAEDREPAAKALRAAAVRMPDRNACAEKLVAAMPNADMPQKVTLLETLGAMEGEVALKAIGSIAHDGSPELQDVASQLLGKWMTVDAAPVLMGLAKSDIDNKYKIRALRGFIRIARQFDLPEKQRAEMSEAAMAAAERDEERKLVLEVLERYPSVETMRLAVAAAKTPALADEAKATALAIAQKIGGSADVGALLAQAGQKPVKVEILKAEYGAGAKSKDVTEVVRKRAGSLPLIVLPSSSYNSSFGGDPVPGVVKQLKIQYRIDGKPGEATFKENATIMLPVPK